MSDTGTRHRCLTPFFNRCTVILKQHLFSYKNRLLGKRSNFGLFNKDMLLALSVIAAMCGLYIISSIMLSQLAHRPELAEILPVKLLSLSFLCFFFLLLFSNTIAAVSSFFGAKDTNLFLYTPTSTSRLYFTRLAEVMINSSWMFLMFVVPVLLAYWKVFELPFEFLLCLSIVVPTFLLIPAALSSIIRNADH